MNEDPAIETSKLGFTLTDVREGENRKSAQKGPIYDFVAYFTKDQKRLA